MKKRPVVVRASRVRIACAASAMISGLRIRSIWARGARDHRDGRGGDHRARPQRVDGDAVRAELLGHAEHAHAHPVLRHRVGDVVAEPLRGSRLNGGDSVRMCGLRPAAAEASRCGRHACEQRNVPRTLTPNMRSKRFIGVASGAGQADRARVVDEDVDAAERCDGRGDRGLHRGLVADVAGDRQRLAAGLLDLRGRGVDRSRQLRIRRGGLGRDRDVGAVARGAHGDREPDAARAAGDEQRLAGERRHRGSVATEPRWTLLEERRDALDEVVGARTLRDARGLGVAAARTASGRASRARGAWRCAARAPARSAIDVPRPSTAASSSAAGTTRLTRPMRERLARVEALARAARSPSPCAVPTTRGSDHVPPPSGVRPIWR